MKRHLLWLALGILLCLPANARERLSGWCEQGNATAFVGGLPSNTKFQGSFPACTVTIFDSGTANLSSIFSDNAGTVLANPFTADADGHWFFYADNARYDIRFSGGGIDTPFTLGDFLLQDGLSGVQEVVTFSATPIFDSSTADIFDMTLTGNVTSSTISNPSIGKGITFIIRQDGTGGRTFAFPGDVVLRDIPAIDAIASSVTIIGFTYDGTNWEETNSSSLGQSVATPKVNKTIRVDGRTVTSVEAAVDRCVTDGLTADCRIVDDRQGLQTWTSDPFAGHAFPITLNACPNYTWNTEDFAVDVESDFTLNFICSTAGLKSATQGQGGFSTAQSGMLNARITTTTGSATAATATLTVASATNIDVGDRIAVIGAEGGNSNQRTTLSGAHTDSVATLTVASVSGWANVANYVLLDGSEIALCTGTSGATFTGCSRGALGTSAAAYSGGENVDAVGFAVRDVTVVSGTTITVDSNYTFTVVTSPVEVGSSNIRLTGTGTIDGNQDRGGADPTNNLLGFLCRLCSRPMVEAGILFKDIDHGGVFLTAAKDYFISGSYKDNTRPATPLGADIWVFGMNAEGRIETVSHQDGYIAIAIDDRSTNYSTYSGPNIGVTGTIGPIIGNTANSFALTISGSNENMIRLTHTDVVKCVLVDSGQWTTNPAPSGNVVDAGMCRGTSAGNVINMGPTAVGGNNFIKYGRLAQANTVICSVGNLCVGHLSTDDYDIWGTLRLRQDTAAVDTELHYFSGDSVLRWIVENLNSDNSYQIIDNTTGHVLAKLTGTQIDLNPGGDIDVDIRMRSDTQSGCFFINSGTDSASMACPLDVGARVDANRFHAEGTALVAGDIDISHASWGTGETVTAVTGNDQWFQFTVNSGTTSGANPETIITFTDGTFTTAPIVLCNRQEFAVNPTFTVSVTTVTATAITLTLNGTPTDSSAFIFACHVGGI